MLLPEKEDSLIFSDGRRLLVLETMRCHSFVSDSSSRPLNFYRRQQSADRGLAEKTCEGREGGVLPFEGYLAHNPSILQLN